MTLSDLHPGSDILSAFRDDHLTHVAPDPPVPFHVLNGLLPYSGLFFSFAVYRVIIDALLFDVLR